jgi:hypothetical protein
VLLEKDLALGSRSVTKEMNQSFMYAAMVALLTSINPQSAFATSWGLMLLPGLSSGSYLLAASFRAKIKGAVAPCSCVPALKMSLYAG